MTDVNRTQVNDKESEKNPAKKPPAKQGEVPRKRDDSQEG
ncbi:hypothetical protein [Siccibacter colletis]|nr:hypothetical protein [Siccibacter colletis]WNN46807.1 hypothetical protein RIN58_10190 [Siccibacter colletis]